MRRSRTATLALACALVSRAARADDPAPMDLSAIEDLDLEALVGRVSAASRMEESALTAPASVTVLTAADIRHSGAASLPDVLRIVPGLQVIRNAAGSYLVSLRGAGGVVGNNVVVMLDGLPVNSRIDGSVDWAAIPVALEGIERIEIVRGPVGTMYGANAYAGVIDVVTAQNYGGLGWGAARGAAAVDLDGRPMASVSARLGRVDERLSWRVLPHVVSDGTFASTADAPAQRHMLVGGTARVRLAVGDSGALVAQLAGSRSSRTSIDHLIVRPGEQQGTMLLGSLQYELRRLPVVPGSLNLWLRGRHARIAGEDTAEPTFSYGGAQATDGEAGVDLRLTLAPWATALVGATALLARVDAAFLHPEEDREYRLSGGGYAQARLDVTDWLVVNGGGRIDRSGMTGIYRLSGRGAVTYHRRSTSVRLSASTAYRDPTYVEVGGRFMDPREGLILLEGNPDLVGPSVMSAELAVIHVPNQRVSIRPAVFASRLKGAVVEDTASIVRRTFRNEADPRDLVGAELELLLPVPLGPRTTAHLNLSALRWLGDAGAQAATFGHPEQNAQLGGWAAVRSLLLDDRIGASIGAAYSTGRVYDTRTGIPPARLSQALPARLRLEAALDGRVERDSPWRLFVKAATHAPSARAESPLPGAGRLGTMFYAGIEYGH